MVMRAGDARPTRLAYQLGALMAREQLVAQDPASARRLLQSVAGHALQSLRSKLLSLDTLHGDRVLMTFHEHRAAQAPGMCNPAALCESSQWTAGLMVGSLCSIIVLDCHQILLCHRSTTWV